MSEIVHASEKNGSFRTRFCIVTVEVLLMVSRNVRR